LLDGMVVMKFGRGKFCLVNVFILRENLMGDKF
jgi:hypothetical protein